MGLSSIYIWIGIFNLILQASDNVGAEVVPTSVFTVKLKTTDNDWIVQENEAPEPYAQLDMYCHRMNEATEAVNNSITRRLVGCRSEQARSDIRQFKMYIDLPLANLTTSGQDEYQNETVKQMVSEWKLVISRQFKVDSDDVDLKLNNKTFQAQVITFVGFVTESEQFLMSNMEDWNKERENGIKKFLSQLAIYVDEKCPLIHIHGERVKGNDQLNVEVHLVFDVTDRNLVGADELNSIMKKLSEEYEGTMKFMDFEIRVSTEKSGAQFEEAVGAGDAGKSLQEDSDEMTDNEDGNDSKMEEDLKENKKPPIANTSTTGQPMSNASLNVDVNTEKVEQLKNINQDSTQGQASPSEPTEKRVNDEENKSVADSFSTAELEKGINRALVFTVEIPMMQNNWMAESKGNPEPYAAWDPLCHQLTVTVQSTNNILKDKLLGCRSRPANKHNTRLDIYVLMPRIVPHVNGWIEYMEKLIGQLLFQWNTKTGNGINMDLNNMKVQANNGTFLVQTYKLIGYLGQDRKTLSSWTNDWDEKNEQAAKQFLLHLMRSLDKEYPTLGIHVERFDGWRSLYVEALITLDVTKPTTEVATAIAQHVAIVTKLFERSIGLIDFEIEILDNKVDAHYDEAFWAMVTEQPIQEVTATMTDNENENDDKIGEDMKQQKMQFFTSSLETDKQRKGTIRAYVFNLELEQSSNNSINQTTTNSDPYYSFDPPCYQVKLATNSMHGTLKENFLGCRSRHVERNKRQFVIYVAEASTNSETNGHDECRTKSMLQLLSNWKEAVGRQFNVTSDAVELELNRNIFYVQAHKIMGYLSEDGSILSSWLPHWDTNREQGVTQFLTYLAKSIDTQFPLILIDQRPSEGWRSLFVEMQLMLDVTKTTVVEPNDLLGGVTAISEEYTPSVKLADFEIKAPTVPDPTKHLFSKCDGIKSVHLDQKPNESSRETEGDVEMMEESDADEDATGIPENTDEHVERTENDNEAGSRVTDLPAVATNMSGTHTYGDIRFNATEKASDEDISPMNDGGDGNYDKTGGNMKKTSNDPQINSTGQCNSTTEESESKFKSEEETDTEYTDTTEKTYVTPMKFPAQEITEGERNGTEDNNVNAGHMTIEDSNDGTNTDIRNTTENGKRGIQETLGDANGKRDDRLVA